MTDKRKANGTERVAADDLDDRSSKRRKMPNVRGHFSSLGAMRESRNLCCGGLSIQQEHAGYLTRDDNSSTLVFQHL